ncbi:hypothetical protein ILP92_13875 [Maribius pontilimi]|uniref:CN hydrolase domain-containing protein n=1 Tax=Palleronia pontilimi TaxID=1964209 RepID=A0A934IJ22_9RHOB|nr:nitrilase-related carbon-nitrogen hydrolase [Palleronia pontilimi]MBJ3763841.1 hypothetical protein [Palleronia pontilimi]
MGEAAVFERGPTILQIVDSPHGRLSVAICKDMSFPRLALQAGQAGVDIMLTGSSDFPTGITLNDPYRAVENGFTLIRPTYDGITYAMDPYERLLGQMNREFGEAGIMYLDVPTEGVRTAYGRFGDWLGWLSVALVGLFAAGAVVFGDRAPRPHSLEVKN